MGAVDLVVQVEAPPSVASGLQRVGRAGHQVGAVSRGVMFPKFRGDLVADRGGGRADAGRRDRGAALPAQPARRARPADRRDGARWSDGTVDELFALVRRAAPFADAADVGAARRCSTCCPGATRQRRVRRAAAADRLGPGHRHAHRPAGRAAARGDQRRHDPRPRAVRRLPGRRRRRARPPGRRAGRGDGVRVAGRRRVHARLDVAGGSRTSPTTGCWSRPRPGSRAAAVLEGRRARPAGRAGPGARRVRPRDRLGLPRRRRRGAGARRPGWTSGRAGQPAGLPGRAAGRRPGTCPTTGRSWSSGSATSWATGGWSCTRRTARQVHAPWALAIAARLRERYGVDVQAMHCRRRHRAAAAGRPTTASRPSRRARAVRPGRRSSRWSPPRSAGRRCSPPGSGSARPGRCCCPGATRGRRTPLWQQRQRAAQLLSGGQRVRLVPDRARDGARVPAGRLRRAGAGRS